MQTLLCARVCSLTPEITVITKPQIEQLAFSFDGGVTNLNFAEAALLIQDASTAERCAIVRACVRVVSCDWVYVPVCAGVKCACTRACIRTMSCRVVGVGVGMVRMCGVCDSA